MKIKVNELLGKSEKNVINIDAGTNKIKISDLTGNKKINVNRKSGAKEAEDAYRNSAINRSFDNQETTAEAPIRINNTQLKKSNTDLQLESLIANAKEQSGGQAWDDETLRLNRLQNERAKLLSYMTPVQRNKYNAAEQNARDAYINSIRDELNQKLGVDYAKEVLNEKDKGNQFAKTTALGVSSGVNSFMSGLKGAGYAVLGKEGKTVTRGANEYAFGAVRPNISGVQGVAADVAQSVGNMLPSIGIGVLTGGLGGTLSMGVSSGGNAYDEAIQKGNSVNRARVYGVASGVKEAALQQILGALPGINNAEGMVTRTLGKYSDAVLAKAISNPATRKAITTVIGNALSEGTEEGVQEAIDVLLGNVILGENEKLNLGDVAYAAGLGAITGGAFALPGGVSTYINGRNGNIETSAAVDEGTKAAEVPEVEVNKQNAADNKRIIVKRDMSNADDVTMQTIKNQYESSTDNNFVKFIKSARDSVKNNWMKFKLKKVSDANAQDIKRLTGIDVHGYNTEIGGSAINHIDKRHGVNGQADSSMADVNDIARMQYVIDNYDEIELTGNYNNEFKNSDGSPSPTIQMKKRVNGDYYVIEAVPDSSKETVHIVSAYKTAIKKEERQVANATRKSVPSAYGRTELGLSSDNIISNNTENINTSEETNAENSLFKKGIEKFKSGDYTSADDIVVLEETPLWLYNKGVDWGTPITLNMSKLKDVMKEPKGRVKGVNQHGITMDIVEQLPEAIKNPLNVIKPNGFNDRFVVVTDLVDQYGDPVIVPIEVNSKGKIEGVTIDVSKINSIYGKEDYDTSSKGRPAGYMEYNKNNIVYDIDKSGVPNGISSYRFQPKETPLFNSNNIISNNSENINTSEETNAENIVRTENPISEDVNLTEKETSYIHRATNTLLNDFLEITGANNYTDIRGIKNSINTFAEASAKNGSVDRAEAENLFDMLWQEALVKTDEMYMQYKDIAQQIKNTKLYGGGLGSEYSRLRKELFNKVRLVSEPSAKKIDSLYKELSENHPELFDADITNIEDQVIAMADVVNMINTTEKKLVDVFNNINTSTEQAKAEFMASLDTFEQSINDVVRYTKSKEAKGSVKKEIADKVNAIRTDKAYAKQFYEDMENAKRAYDKLAGKEMFTDDDINIMRQLSNGVITMAEVEKRADEFNVNGIKRVYEAYKTKTEYEKVQGQIKKSVNGEYRQQAKEKTANSDGWRDFKTGAAYMRETMERIFEGITMYAHGKNRRNEEAADIIKTYITPIHENEAKSNRLKNELVGRIKALNLGTKPMYTVTIKNDVTGMPQQTKVSESGLVQLYGEGIIDDTILDRLNVDKEKIHNAVKEFRDIYNELIDMVNDTLIRNGYEPVAYRKDYFPHFTENKPDSLLGGVAGYFGIDVNADSLPTDIAGITHTFRPGKKWVGNFLERKTNVTDYDALKGFDRYINGAADVIFHTDDIQRLRALESELRYKYSDEGIRKSLREVEDDVSLTTEQKQSRIEEIMKNYKVSHLPNLVTELRNYTDNLAGKKSIVDRNLERFFGRGIYNFSKRMENRFSANVVALNPASWLTNFIPITQVSGIVDSRNLASAIKDTVKSCVRSDGFSNRSDFLINRRGSETAYERSGFFGKADKAVDIITKPFEIIDSFTADVVTRALYYDRMAKVHNEAEALAYANDMAARVMADRSKGATPTAFNVQNPLVKLVTMFQVEVNNQYSYMFKDVPAEMRKEGLGKLAAAFIKMFLGAFLYNEVYEKFIGRRAAFDPFDIIGSAYSDFTNPDIKKSQAALRTAANIGDELPFFGSLMGGGRVPISSALPDIVNVTEAGIGLWTGEMNDKKAMQQLGKELIKPAAYLIPPVGGGQIKKIYEGASTVAHGGEFTYDSEGDKRLKYPIEDKSLGKYAQAMVFGKSALPEARAYYENGMPKLSVNQTQNYYKAVEAGISYNQYMAALKSVKGLESDKDKDGKTISLSLAKKQKAAIDEAVKDFNLTKKQKEILYEANGVSEKVW